MADDNNKNENLPAELRDKVGEVLRGLPKDKRAELVQVVQQVARFHRGPLPDAETLEHYNRIIPNGGERLMKLVEDQAAHRQKQESSLVWLHQYKTIAGQIIAACLSIMFGVAAYKLGMAGHDVLAGTMATTTILGIITVFVLGQLYGDSDDDDEPPRPSSPEKRK